jgi:hypothetical protein
MGAPRLFVGITAGNLDSMLNKLTAQKKVRAEDQYSPGGRTGMRPNRAATVYSNLARQAFPGVPIVLGGIEASLRSVAVGVASYERFVDAVVVALERGTPLADVLRAQADDVRGARRRTLLELAGRRDVLMLVPVVFLILPTVVLIALFPAAHALRLLST